MNYDWIEVATIIPGIQGWFTMKISINIIYNISRLEDKIQMIILIHAKKYYKLLLIHAPQKNLLAEYEWKETFLIDKEYHQKFTVSILIA